MGLVVAWGMLYGLFNGLQVYWTGDEVYFFMDFTVKSTPFIAVGLTAILGVSYGVACGLSWLKWQLMGYAAARGAGGGRSKQESARLYLLAAAEEEEADAADGSAAGYRLWDGQIPGGVPAVRAHR